MSLLDRLFRREGGDEKEPEAEAPDPANHPTTRPPKAEQKPSRGAMANSSPHNRTAPEPVRPVPPMQRPSTTASASSPPAAPPPPAGRTSGTPRGIAPLGLSRPWSQRKRQQREDMGAAIASFIEKAVDELGDPVIDRALDNLVDRTPVGSRSVKEGVSTPVDLAAVQATYQELAIEYCAPVRNVMIEVGRAEPPVSMLDFVRPAIEWLQGTAEKMDLTDLARALEGFKKALAAAARASQSTISGEVRRSLQRAYAPLVVQLPQAFDIEGERERREHIILRSLLLLVPGVDAMVVDRILAAGLNTLQTLGKARAEELAAVAGLDRPLAERIVAALRAERGAAGLSLAAADVLEEKRRLKSLVAKLASEHDGFERACKGWTEAHREDKRRLRQEREMTFLRVKVSLARLGDVDRIVRLERLPYGSKIQELETQLRIAAANGASGSRPSSPLLKPGSESLRQRDT
jgi:hypothetical protein